MAGKEFFAMQPLRWIRRAGLIWPASCWWRWPPGRWPFTGSFRRRPGSSPGRDQGGEGSPEDRGNARTPPCNPIPRPGSLVRSSPVHLAVEANWANRRARMRGAIRGFSRRPARRPDLQICAQAQWGIGVLLLHYVRRGKSPRRTSTVQDSRFIE